MKSESDMRIEKDSLGEVQVPSKRYYGAQTQRSLHNFHIGQEKMPMAVVYATTQIKKAAALTHRKLKLLNQQKSEAIIQACDEILQGQLDDEFPLSVWQSGSGTQTHMNVNEVISNRANEILGSEKGLQAPVHPNDDVNKSQSTNDVISSAVQMAAATTLKQKLLPALAHLHQQLIKKQNEFAKVIAMGRTHMGDAVPMYLGQRFSAYVDQVQQCLGNLDVAMRHLLAIPIGGTAIGTGLNLPENYIEHMVDFLASQSGLHITSCDNFFSHQASLDVLVEVSGHLNTLSTGLIKLANDIRLMSSGPRCGLGEISLPINEPGSSIMPGKINPTQCEALIMVATRVQGNHVTISLANSLVSFEAHSFRPVMIYSLLQSMTLISDMVMSFVDNCLQGIKVNDETLAQQLERSLALATVLNTSLGYEKASKIAKKAYAENTTLKEAAVDLGFLSPQECDELLDPKKMV